MATAVRRRNIVRNAGRFLQEVWGELKKVQWPNREELYGFTVLVIIAVIAMGIYIGLLDVVLSRLSEGIFQLGGPR